MGGLSEAIGRLTAAANAAMVESSSMVVLLMVVVSYDWYGSVLVGCIRQW